MLLRYKIIIPIAKVLCNSFTLMATLRCLKTYIDECANVTCNTTTSTVCVDLLHDYKCECKPGFTDRDCLTGTFYYRIYSQRST